MSSSSIGRTVGFHPTERGFNSPWGRHIVHSPHKVRRMGKILSASSSMAKDS